MSKQYRKANNTIRIGTRGSPLALWQAREVSRLIQKFDPSIKIEEIIIRTSGDKSTSPIPSLQRRGISYTGKGLFVKEIEEALLAGKIDIAVHSLKDVPAVIPSRLKLTAYLKREDPFDLFISAKYKNIISMPKGARVGTSSPRRAAQILNLRPDIKIIPLRGNVETRIRKMAEGECDATMLACAGIKRLELTHKLTNLKTHKLTNFIPAIGQGIICIESREKGVKFNKFIYSALKHK